MHLTRSFDNKKRSRFVLAVVTLLVLFYSVLSYVVPPGVFSDSAAGFVQGDSFLKGAHWTELIEPDPLNIANDRHRPFVVWSPAQHMIPMVFEALGFSLGQSIVVTLFFLSSLGLLGFFLLFERLGFSRMVTLVSMLVIATQRYFSHSYGMYQGGEVFLLAYTPWIVLAALHFQDLKWAHCFWLLLLFLLGFFFKLSFMISALALLAFMWFRAIYCTRVNSERRVAHMVGVTGKAASVFAVFYLLVNYLFLSKGWNASKTTADFSLSRLSESLKLSLASPLWSSFSVGDLFSRIFCHPSNQIFKSPLDSTLLVLLSIAISLCIFVCVLKCKTISLEYRQLIAIIFISHFFVYMYLFIMTPAVAIEDRRFRMVGVLLIPGCIHALAALKIRFIRILAFTGIALTCVYGFTSFLVRFHANYTTALIGKRGYTQHIVSREALQALHAVDEKLSTGNNIIYLSTPEVAPEVRKNRMDLWPVDFYSQEFLASLAYYGTVDNLVVFMLSKFSENGKAEPVLRSFKNYHYDSWKNIQVGNMIVYYQGSTDLRALLSNQSYERGRSPF